MINKNEEQNEFSHDFLMNTDDNAISKTTPRDNEDPIQKARGEYKNHCSGLRINRYIMNNNISLVFSY